MRKDDCKIWDTAADDAAKIKQAKKEQKEDTAYQRERNMQLQINRYNAQNKEGDYE